MPQYILHIPQARSARIHGYKKHYNIAGLYTCGISTCVILVGISKNKDKAILSHIDLQMTDDNEQIKNEIDWLGESPEIIFVYRSGYKTILPYLIEALFKHNIKATINIEFDADHDGILVSLNESLDGTDLIHPNIKNFLIREKPQNLIYHPQEQFFLAITKIEQIIGLEAKIISRSVLQKMFVIFDGAAWRPIPENELKINIAHETTKNEMKYFKADQPFLLIEKFLEHLQVKLKTEYNMQSPNNRAYHMEDIAFWFEGLLNEFDAEKLFKNNLLNSLDQRSVISVYRNATPTDSDKKYIENIIKILKSSESPYNKTMNFIKNNQGEMTPFKTELKKDIDLFNEHYKNRKLYQEQASLRASGIEQARNIMSKGVKAYNNLTLTNTNNSAENLFHEALSLLTIYTTKDDQNLCRAYYNLGKTLMRTQEFEPAENYLIVVDRLQTEFPSSDSERLKKYKSSLEECKRLLSKAPTTTKTSTI